MTGRGVTVLVGLLALASCGTAAAQTDDGDGYVNGQKGTYRGRVLDAGTGRPLAGVVVVAVWRRDRVAKRNRGRKFAKAPVIAAAVHEQHVERAELRESGAILQPLRHCSYGLR